MKKRILGLLTALCVTASPFTPAARADESTPDPVYHVYISRENAEYTATVTLENIAATYGTFGLKYDSDLFKFDPSKGLSLEDGVNLKFTPYSMYGGEEWKTDDGYYLFVWQAGGYNDTVLDTEQEAKQICTMKFTLKDPALADSVTFDTFTVIPWHKTPPAIAYEQYLTAEGFTPRDYYSEYWRYTDEANDKLERGRLEKSKSAVSGADAGGFYQAAVNGDADDETSSYFYDVKTDIKYDESVGIKNSFIKFHVIDAESGEDIEDAQVNVYEEGLGEKDTDNAGEASYEVDIDQSGTYRYTVTKDGYYPEPESGLAEDRPELTLEAGAPTLVTAQLRRKIYHVPVIKPRDGTQQAEMIDAVTLGGDEYGYNGKDFYFSIKPAQGYQLTAYPTTATVSVGEETDIEIPIDPETGQFKLTGDKLYQDPLDGVPPDEHGWRSDDIIITFDKFAVKEANYEVTALTNENGSITYTRKSDELTVSTDLPREKLITTTAQNRKTGTFTFSPANEGYKVEKVYINGLQIHTYDGFEKFDYTFDEVDMDNNITVFFYDGTHPSTDTIMTLVVGEYGTVNTTALPEETGVTKTRRVYMNPSESLTFTAEGIEGYELDGIEVETDGAERTAVEIHPDDTSQAYTFDPPDPGGGKTVYVSFKSKQAEKTPTVYIKSYVESGRGTVNPCGILIYNQNDTPDFVLTGEEKDGFFVKGVVIGDFDMDNKQVTEFDDRLHEKTYTMAPLTQNTSIGAVFTEKGYLLRGYVDLGQGSNVTPLAPKAGAVVTFTRTDEEGNEIPLAAEYKAETTASRNNAVFTVELPEGTWTVTVTKQGYVRHTITKFTFRKPADETAEAVFGEREDGTVKKITPYIGSTRTGMAVSLTDAAVVWGGMRENVNSIAKQWADVDNDGSVCAKDMVYVRYNYGQRAVTEEYSDFLQGAYPVIPKE